jgi:hypothetical protein
MLKLVNADKELCYESDGSMIFYKELAPREMDDLSGLFLRSKGKKSAFDFAGSKRETLRRGVTRWEGVQDAAGQEVPYHPDLLDFLPTETRDALYLAIAGRSPVPEDAEENP